MLMMLCAFEYVLNELNFCHVFIIIECVSLELLMMFEKLCWLVKMLKSRVHAFAYYETVELLLKATVEHLLKATVKHINAYIWYHMHDVKMLRVAFSESNYWHIMRRCFETMMCYLRCFMTMMLSLYFNMWCVWWVHDVNYKCWLIY